MNLIRAIWSVALLLFISALGCSGDDSISVSSPRYSELSDSSFAVGDSSVLEISNFAGKVDVTSGNPHVVHVVAKKWAGRQGDLDEIEVEMVELQNGVHVGTASPSGLNNVSVDLAVTVPTDLRPNLQAGAGTISYKGRAEGECFFAVSAGSITLRLPADVNVEVYLSVAAGTIRVDFPVTGQIGAHVVDGIIGTGVDGRIVAQVGAGNIIVTSQ
ncbi:MAG: hypothetical protein OEN01_14500 [Candidatus Krumholzibacteria bacterium]|nr:hypothetical protein [Candidatus Krumholzibacteria bacterium]